MKHHSPVFQVRPLEERVDADVEDAGAEVLDGHLHLQQPHLPGRRLHALATTHARTSCIRSGESNFSDAVKMQTVVSCVGKVPTHFCCLIFSSSMSNSFDYFGMLLNMERQLFWSIFYDFFLKVLL